MLAVYGFRFENSANHLGHVGYEPFVKYIAENRHNINAVGGVEVIICNNEAHIVFVECALQKTDLKDIATYATLVFDDDRIHVTLLHLGEQNVKP